MKVQCLRLILQSLSFYLSSRNILESIAICKLPSGVFHLSAKARLQLLCLQGHEIQRTSHFLTEEVLYRSLLFTGNQPMIIRRYRSFSSIPLNV